MLGFYIPSFLILLSLMTFLSLIRKHSVSQFFSILLVFFPFALFVVLYTSNPGVKALLLLLFIQLQQLSLEDLKYHKVFLWEVLLLLPSSVLLIFFQSGLSYSIILPGLLGFLLIFLPFLLSHKKGMGIADVIVFTILSFTLYGFEPIFLELFSAVLGLLGYFVFSQILKKKENHLPYLPFIAFGWWILIFIKTYFPTLLTRFLPTLSFWQFQKPFF